MTRIVSFWLLVAIIVAVSLGFYRVMSGFLLPLFLAALLVVIFKPLHEWLLVRLRHAMLAAGIATTAVVLIVFVPLIWSLTLAANEAISVARQFDANRVTRQIQRLQILLRLDLPLVEETLELTPLLDDLLLEPVAVSPSGASEQETGEKTTSERKTVEKATSDLATAEKESPERNSPDRQSSDDPDTAGNVPGGRSGPGDASESPTTTAPATTAPSTRSSALPELGNSPVLSEPPLAPTYYIERLATLETLRARLHELQRQLPLRQSNAARPELSEIHRQMDALSLQLASVQMALDDEDHDLYLELVRAAKGDFERLQGSLPGGVWRVVAKRVIYPNAAQVQELKDRLVREVQELLVPAANATAGFAAKLIFGTIIMIVSVFFFFADGKKMTVTVMRLVPLDVRHQEELLTEFGRISRAVVLATLVSAVVQGLLAGIGFYFAGTGSVALLVLLTIVFAMIPFVGALSVWVPVVAWMGFVEGNTWTAIILGIYCAIVVSQSDNVVKPVILKGHSNIHPLLALLSILGGVQALGPVGILVGPMIVVFLQTLLNILHREMTSLETAKQPPTTG
ncbi:MAG: AI-2E family transporter [Planctomycetota bacterium]